MGRRFSLYTGSLSGHFEGRGRCSRGRGRSWYKGVATVLERGEMEVEVYRVDHVDVRGGKYHV